LVIYRIKGEKLMVKAYFRNLLKSKYPIYKEEEKSTQDGSNEVHIYLNI